MANLFATCRKPARALSKGPMADVLARGLLSDRTRVGKGCACGSTPMSAKVLSAFGMRTAASMHKRIAVGTPSSAFGGQWWKSHINEEDERLFPAFDAVLTSDDQKLYMPALRADHVVYLELISENEPLPTGSAPNSIDAHGKIEDMLLEKYAAALLAYAKAHPAAPSSTKTSGVLFDDEDLDLDDDEAEIESPALASYEETMVPIRVGDDNVPSTTDGSTADIPQPPTTSTGNANADAFRKNIYSYAVTIGKYQPETIPFLAVGVGIVYAWVAVASALFGGDDGDSKFYADEVAAMTNEYLRRGMIPPKMGGLADVVFIKDLYNYGTGQLEEMTAQGSPVYSDPSILSGTSLQQIATIGGDGRPAIYGPVPGAPPKTPGVLSNPGGLLDPNLAPAYVQFGAALQRLITDVDVQTAIKSYVTGIKNLPHVGYSLWGCPCSGGEKTGGAKCPPPCVDDQIAVMSLLLSKVSGASLSDVQATFMDFYNGPVNGFCAVRDCSAFGGNQSHADASMLAYCWIATASKYGVTDASIASAVPSTSSSESPVSLIVDAVTSSTGRTVMFLGLLIGGGYLGYEYVLPLWGLSAGYKVGVGVAAAAYGYGLYALASPSQGAST